MAGAGESRAGGGRGRGAGAVPAPEECPPPDRDALACILERLPVAVFVLDAAGRPCYANQASNELLGVGPDATVPPERLPDAYRACVAGTGDRYPEHRLPVVRALQGETTTVDDLDIHRAQGVVPVEGWGAPVLDENGDITYAVAVFRDVSERRRAERQSRELAERAEAEEAARQDARRLGEAERLAHLGSWETDLLTGATTWSEELYRLLGLRRGEVEPTRDRVLAAVHPDDREAVEERLRRLLDTHEPVEGVHRVVRPDGEVRWLHDRHELLVSNGSGAVKLVGTALDVTDRKRVEDELKAAELRFGAGFVGSPVGSALVSPEGRFMMVNPALCRMLGRSQDELCQMTFAELTHPDDVEAGRRRGDQILAGEIPATQLEKRYLRPDGQVVWVLLTVSLVRGDAGSALDYFFTQVQDITERKRAEQEAEHRALQQAAVAALGSRALAGADPEVLMAEAVEAVAEQLGSDTASVVELLPGGDAVAMRAAAGWPASMLGATFAATPGSQAAYAFASREPLVVDDLSTETRFSPHPLVLERGLASGVSVVINVGGNPYGLLSAHTTERTRFSADDVNFVQAVANVLAGAIERRRHEELQERAHRQDRLAAVGQLAAGVAHDFNNIVSVISLYTELLQAQQGLDDAGRAHLGGIGQQVERAVSLVWQVLDYANRTPPQLVEVDLAVFLDELVPVLARTLPPEVRIALHHEGTGRHVIQADPTRLQQILMNLVSNARDALNGAGQVRITVAGDARHGECSHPGHLDGPEHQVRLEVADDGAGMSTDVAVRAFEPFFTTKPSGRGTGLGLAQVQGLVTDHRGHVDIESRPGAGTTVGVCLPGVLPPDRPVPAAGSELEEGSGKRVLVVDDDPAARGALAQLLGSRGYAAVTAADGQEALAVVDQLSQPVDVVVSDVMMPGMGGEGLERALRERSPAVPVILVSGHPHRGHAASGPAPADRDKDSVVRLAKPFSSHQLAEALRRCLAR